MIVVSGQDPLFDEVVKDTEEKEKQYEDAMKENKAGVDMLDDINKKHEKEAEGKYPIGKNDVKTPDLKKMHLSESMFADVEIEDEDIDECMAEAKKFIESLNNSKFAMVYPDRAKSIVEKLTFSDSLTMNEGFSAWDKLMSAIDGIDEELDLNEEDYLDKVSEKILGDVDLGESLKKKIDEALDQQIINKIADEIVDAYPKTVDIYSTDSLGPYAKIVFEIDNGDWKHEHLAFRYWMKKNAEELTGYAIKFGGETPIDDSDADVYSAIHTYFFIPKDDILAKTDDEPEIEEETEEEEMTESLKFNIAKEQIKRFNEGKMPPDWNAHRYLEKLVEKKHITQEESDIIVETFLNK